MKTIGLIGGMSWESTIPYTEEDYRCQGISGNLLNMVVEDMKSKGITPIYLVTDHIGFYERYGWEFFCMAQGDGEPEPTRLYIHR